MKLFDAEYMEVMKCFEKIHGEHSRETDRKTIKMGYIYQNGEVNNLFKAFLQGYSFGKCMEMQEQRSALESVRDRVGELAAENLDLREALQQYVEFSKEAHSMLDADQDVKCLKLLGAMAGRRGYRPDVDAARDGCKDAMKRREGKDDN